MSFTLQFNDNAAASIDQAAEQAVKAGAEHLMSKAVELTPLETGALRASAKVTSDGKTAAVSYNTPYAARQHEEVGWQHTDGQAKFLETAMLQEADTIKQVLANTIKGAL